MYSRKKGRRKEITKGGRAERVVVVALVVVIV